MAGLRSLQRQSVWPSRGFTRGNTSPAPPRHPRGVGSGEWGVVWHKRYIDNIAYTLYYLYRRRYITREPLQARADNHSG